MALTAEEQERYHRHLILREVGPAGQALLHEARVAVVGMGGLGCPAATYLTAMGLGTIGLIDGDQVDRTNLQRQPLYQAADAGRPKAIVARERLLALNPHVDIHAHTAWLSPANTLGLLSDYDLVICCCDNYPTRYLVNDACVLMGTPCIDGCVYRFEGQVTVYDTPAGGPCYRCRFPQPPARGGVPDGADVGVLGFVPGVVGSLQAAEAVKLLLRGLPEFDCRLLVGRILVVDLLGAEFLELPLSRDPCCPVCGDRPTITALVSIDQAAERDSDQAVETDIIQQIQAAPERFEIAPTELARRLVGPEPPLLLDVREPWEWEHCRIDGARLLPLSQFPAGLAGLPADREIITYCHAGVRSLDALIRLHRAGHQRVRSLRGGIDAWSQLVDPSVPRY